MKRTKEAMIKVPYRTVKEAKCNNGCGEPVAWCWSHKKGKWYLADGILSDKEIIPMAHKPHYISCPKINSEVTISYVGDRANA